MSKLNDFLDTYDDKGTKKLIKTALNKFFKTINKDPEAYIKEDQTYQEDIKNFSNSLSELSSCTNRNYIGAVRDFLDHYEVELKKKFWKELKRKGKLKKARAETQDHIPTFDEMKSILTQATLMERTMISIMSSSGLRPDELLGLLKTDIDIESKPTTIYIRAEIAKEGKARTTFMSTEATNYLNEWYKIRETYIKNTYKKVNFPNVKKTPLDRNEIFPMAYETIRRRFIKILEASKLDQRDSGTKHYRIHLHVFRKYFETNLEVDGCERIFVEALTGHEDYMSTYRQPSEQALRDAYLKHENCLLIFYKNTDVSKLENKQDNLKEQFENLKTKYDVEKLKNENFEREQIKHDERLNKIEHILTRNLQDNINPFHGTPLSKEENELEDKLEIQLNEQEEKWLKKQLATDPRYKDYEIAYRDQYIGKDGNFKPCGAFLIKKQSKKTMKDVLDELPDIMNKDIVLSVLANLDTKKQQELLQQANNLKHSKTNRQVRKHR